MGEPEQAIRWPADYAPAACPIHVVNRLETSTDPALIWSRLIAAPRWPEIYANASDVKIAGGAERLSADARFTWKTFGVALKSEVREFEPETRIAWLAIGLGVRAYHAWLITPTATGCVILTEETQHGFVARAGRVLFPGRMERWHQRWLEALAE